MNPSTPIRSPFALNFSSDFVAIEIGYHFDQPVYILTLRHNVVTLRLWIDMDEFILLREERFNTVNKIQSIAYRTEVIKNPRFPEDVFVYSPQANVEVYRSRNQWIGVRERTLLSELSGFTVRFPDRIPNGYRFWRSNIISEFDHEIVIIQFENAGDILSIFQNLGTFSRAETATLRRYLSEESSKPLNVQTRNVDGISLVAIGSLADGQLKVVLDSME